MDVDGAVNRDASQPKKDASVLVGILFDFFKRDSKGVFEYVFCQFRYRQTRQNRTPIQRIGKPLKQHAGGLAVALANPFDYGTLLRYWRKVIGIGS